MFVRFFSIGSAKMNKRFYFFYLQNKGNQKQGKARQGTQNERAIELNEWKQESKRSKEECMGQLFLSQKT